MNPPLPITVGRAQLMLGLAALVLGAVRLWRGRRTPRPRQTADYLAPFAGALGLALVALATPATAPLWERFSFLRDLLFPWRWLDGGCLLLALSSGWVVDRALPRPAWRHLLIGVGLCAMFLNALPYLYPPRTQLLPPRPTLADASAAQARYDLYGLTGIGEFRPARAVWRPRIPPFPGADQNASLARKLRPDAGSDTTARDLGGGPLEALLAVDAPRPASLVFETFYFPGWEASLDGRRHPARADASGLLAVDVPAGTHRLRVAFERTRIRAVADALSGLAALACAIGLVRGRRHPPPAPPPPRIWAGSRGGVLPILALVVLLAATKIVWIDVRDSPLVMHVRSGELAGVRRAPWSDFGGELSLLGYTYEPGRALTLYWRAQRTLSRPYTIALTFTTPGGAIAREIRQENPGANWTAFWEAGLLVRDVYELPGHGEYGAAALSIRDRDSDRPLTLRDSPGGLALVTTLSFASRDPAESAGR
jgi:hypothetical protein